MTELNEILLQNVNLKIDDIMLNRLRFHDDEMLNDFMDIVCKRDVKQKGTAKWSMYSGLSRFATMKYNDKTMELREKMTKYSIQKEALVLLNQLLSEIEENPCSYRLIGVSVGKHLIRDLILVLVVSQILQIMWTAAF